MVILDQMGLLTAQENDMTTVADTLCISLPVSSILCRLFKWNVERLIEAYYEDPDAVMAKAGLSDGAAAVQVPLAPQDCGICGDTLEPHQLSSASCGVGPSLAREQVEVWGSDGGVWCSISSVRSAGKATSSPR